MPGLGPIWKMDKIFIDFYNQQLQNWSLAQKNVSELNRIKRKPFKTGIFSGFVQFNPARAVSTLANVEKEAIKERKCFLCSQNRPQEQESLEILPGWELLVNPFPILPYPFTIAQKQHTPQVLDLETGKKLAELLPGMVVFYNADGAGASAPDHCHYQAVRIEDLPLLRHLEEWPDGLSQGFPFKFIRNGEEEILNEIPVNAYFWNSDKGIQTLIIPRMAHRPSHFYKEGKDRRAVSPGAIEMAGIIVTPIEDDYERITDSEIEEIYQEVAYKNEKRSK